MRLLLLFSVILFISCGTQRPLSVTVVPDPFRTRTALSFDLSEAAEVSVDVYDTMGRRVASIDNGTMSAGVDQRVEIDGAGLASGVYLFRLTLEGATRTIVRTGQVTLAR